MKIWCMIPICEQDTICMKKKIFYSGTSDANQLKFCRLMHLPTYCLQKKIMTVECWIKYVPYIKLGL